MNGWLTVHMQSLTLFEGVIQHMLTRHRLGGRFGTSRAALVLAMQEVMNDEAGWFVQAYRAGQLDVDEREAIQIQHRMEQTHEAFREVIEAMRAEMEAERAGK